MYLLEIELFHLNEDFDADYVHMKLDISKYCHKRAHILPKSIFQFQVSYSVHSTSKRCVTINWTPNEHFRF